MKLLCLMSELLLACLLAACAGNTYQQRSGDRLAAYEAAAGAPVRSFHFFSLYSWEPLADTELAVYTRPDEAWLLNVEPGCQRLEFTNGIGLTSTLHQVMARFDKVLIGRNAMPCMIVQIRPVDLGRLKGLREKQRKIENAPRPAGG